MKKPVLTSLVELGMLAAAIIVWLFTPPAPGAVAQTTQATPTPIPSNQVAPLSAMREKALKPKDTFKECANCPEMTVVPAGSLNGGLLQFRNRSPDSQIREMRGKFVESLRPLPRMFPFSGDCGGRLGSIATAA